MNVYAVETGTYSDYRVLALFEHKVDAEKVAKRLKGEDARVVVREVYSTTPPQTTYYAIQRFRRQPGGPWGESSEEVHVVEHWEGSPFVGRLTRGVAYREWPNGERAWGTDKEGVRRRWQEKHQQAEAEDAGL